MSEGRTGAFRAIAGLGFACCGCVAIFGMVSCGGEEFTTSSAGVGDGAVDDAPTPIRDATPAVDGSHHDAAAIDAGGGWCATQMAGHAFCEDFLHGVPDQLVEVVVNGAIAPDTMDFESAPESMIASTPALAKGGSGTAFGSHALSGVNETGTLFAASAYYRIDPGCFSATGPVNSVSILGLNFTDSKYELLVGVTPSSVELIEISTDVTGAMNVQPQVVAATGLVGSWQNWKLDLNGGLTKTASLTIGSAIVFDKVSLKNAPTATVLEHPTAYFGVTIKSAATASSPACKVNVDDILIDVRSEALAN